MGRHAEEEERQRCHRIGDVDPAIRLPVEELQIRRMHGAPIAAGKARRASEKQEPERCHGIGEIQAAIGVGVAGPLEAPQVGAIVIVAR